MLAVLHWFAPKDCLLEESQSAGIGDFCESPASGDGMDSCDYLVTLQMLCGSHHFLEYSKRHRSIGGVEKAVVTWEHGPPVPLLAQPMADSQSRALRAGSPHDPDDSSSRPWLALNLCQMEAFLSWSGR